MTPARADGRVVLSVTLAAAAAACGDAPSFMTPASQGATRIAVLGWWLTGAALMVTALVTGFLLVALFRRSRPEAADPEARAMRWIHAGIVATVAVLAAAFLGTLFTLERSAHPPTEPQVTVEVVGHQWWWEVRYPLEGGDTAVTANEVHIPAGMPVRVRLRTADVIHSFWVPEVAGKTDLTTGQTNETWFEVDRPGTYRGQCAEYCGAQHARMGILLVVEPLETFTAWRARQALPARPAGEGGGAGLDVFQRHCAACHTVRGTARAGVVGPDLTHLADRQTLAAGTVPNTRGHLGGWIADPQAIKPGSLMPRVVLTSEELVRLLDYLQSLR